MEIDHRLQETGGNKVPLRKGWRGWGGGELDTRAAKRVSKEKAKASERGGQKGPPTRQHQRQDRHKYTYRSHTRVTCTYTGDKDWGH